MSDFRVNMGKRMKERRKQLHYTQEYMPERIKEIYLAFKEGIEVIRFLLCCVQGKMHWIFFSIFCFYLKKVYKGMCNLYEKVEVEHYRKCYTKNNKRKH